MILTYFRCSYIIEPSEKACDADNENAESIVRIFFFYTIDSQVCPSRQYNTYPLFVWCVCLCVCVCVRACVCVRIRLMCDSVHLCKHVYTQSCVWINTYTDTTQIKIVITIVTTTAILSNHSFVVCLVVFSSTNLK